MSTKKQPEPINLEDYLPGERLPGESDKAFKAFVCYRDLQPHERSILAVYRRVTSHRNAQHSPSHFHGWCSDFQWVERSAQWDAHLDEARRAEKVEAVKRMEREHSALAEDLVKVSRIGTRALLLRLQRNERQAKRKGKNAPFVGVKSRDLVKLAEVGVKLERLSKGEPTDIGKLKEEVEMTYTELISAASKAKR